MQNMGRMVKRVAVAFCLYYPNLKKLDESFHYDKEVRSSQERSLEKVVESWERSWSFPV